SKTSSSEEFLDVVTPASALISVGRNNRYSHPNADVLQRFREHVIPVFRTDTSGMIILSAHKDGTYTIK
ncbi:MAG: beta-lactamase, partial [Parcubacteria group bacterium Gr01-1014_70]